MISGTYLTLAGLNGKINYCQERISQQLLVNLQKIIWA